tara:strand:- start:835 stop:960 length:126 start_codon:yes stop_codon:yes gene_type:complete
MTNPDDRRSPPTFPTTSGAAANLIGTTSAQEATQQAEEAAR